MAHTITDRHVVADLCRGKQVVEAQLAEALYRLFNSSIAIHKLRKFAKVVLQAMTDGAAAPLSAAIAEESRLRVWDRIPEKSRNGLCLFWNTPWRMKNLDASDVSDIIRLAGCWIEHGGLAAMGLQGPARKDAWGERHSASESIKDAYRTGVPGARGPWQKGEVEAVWSDGKKKFAGTTARRARGAGHGIPPHLRPHMRDAGGFSGIGGLPNNPFIGKRAMGDSNVLKIDRLFGLFIGADISGTTTDSLFALEMWGGEHLTAAYYLLPLATLVHNNHHALIEVALSLSINGIVDYDVGFYRTLRPKNCQLLELANIDGVLTAAEYDKRNRHFVVFYDDMRPAGCLLFSEIEARALKAAGFWKATRLLGEAPNLPSYPSYDTVESLCDRFQVNLAA